MSRQRRRGLLRLGALLAVIAVIVALVSNSGGDTGGGSTSARAGTGDATVPARLVAKVAPRPLRAPISGETVVPQAGGVLVIGGLDSSEESSAGVYLLRSSSGALAPAGSLAQPLHDTAAATINGNPFVFGGGSATTIDAVEALRPGQTATVVGHLPTSRSDLSAVTIGSNVYVLGGYDGINPVAAVLKTSDGQHFATVTNLPTPFRYAAVSALGSTIYAFGGETASEQNTADIQAIDVTSHVAHIVGHLPVPLSHASAIALGGRIYVLGGQVNGKATDKIWVFDPSSRRVSSGGRLPFPVTNAAAAASGGTGFLIGGIGSRGTTLASIITIGGR